MVIPIGSEPRLQQLVRVTRVARDRFEEEQLGGVRFVPLVGADAWGESGGPPVVIAPRRGTGPAATSALIREAAEPIADIDDVDLGPLLDRIGSSKIVLLGEASHGTSEFYQMRARITRELIEKRGFTIVAAEADWPDAARVDRYVRHGPAAQEGDPAFRALPDLDVAKCRRARLRRVAQILERGRVGPRAPGRLLRPRSLQPLHLDRGRAALPG